MFEHTQMKSVCEKTRDVLKSEFKKLAKMSRSDEEVLVKRNLHVVAETFYEIHQLREKADYDHSGNWTRTSVTVKVDAVAAAFKAWKAIRKENMAQGSFLSSCTKAPVIPR